MEVPGSPCAFRLLTAKIREILRTFVPDWRGSASLGVMAHWDAEAYAAKSSGGLIPTCYEMVCWYIGRSIASQLDSAMFTSLFASRAIRYWSAYPNSRDTHVDASRSKT